MLSPGVGKPEQIATVLEKEIRSGALGFGDRLQSENELVQRFSVSRNTVRKGLEDLSSRGLITTKVGIGSFVTFDGKTVDDAIGWSKALADAGANAETRTLRLEVIEDAALAARLGIDNPAFIAVDRARTNAGDGHAISIERSRLPLSAGTGGGSAEGPARGLAAPDAARLPVLSPTMARSGPTSRCCPPRTPPFWAALRARPSCAHAD